MHRLDRPRRLGPIVLALSAPVAAQGVDRHPVTESYAFGSPELTALYDAADMVVVNSAHMAGGGRQWAFFDLGLTALDEVDAFSDGSDIYPATGPAITPPDDCRVIVAEHTVDKAAVGEPAGVVASQTGAGANGAASDTFAFEWRGSSTPIASHASDHLEVTPLPGIETDLDALAWYEEDRYPVYFSVDGPTAAGLGVSPADVLIVGMAGAAPGVHWSAEDLGLSPSDDIDALSVNAGDGPPPPIPDGRVIFSLTPGSPSVTGGGGLAAMGPGALFVAKAAGPEVWATPTQLDLEGPGAPGGADNLNGVRITDPIRTDWCEGDQLHIDGTPWDTLRVNGSDGGYPRIVDVPQSSPFNLSITPHSAGDVCIIYFAGGRPCHSSALFVPGLPGPFVIGLQNPAHLWTTPAPVQFSGIQFPGKIEFTMHGVVFNVFSMQLMRTNLLTVRVR